MIPEKKSESIINFLPPKVKKAIAGGIVAARLATGCNVLVDVPASEKPVEVSTGIPDKEPEKNVYPTQADYELIPTEKATETVINPTPTYTVEASGGEFTLVQDELNQSEEALVQQNRIQRWLDYWVKFDNRPFAEKSAEVEKVSLIEGNIFYDPQSKEDFKNVVLAPSPIDEPEMFAKWQDEYLNQVFDKLETYTGPTISDEYTGIDYNVGRIIFISSDWPVISSYKFRMGNEEILTKTFVYMDKRNGELVPLSFTYPPEDSYFFKDYKTPDEKRILYTHYLFADEMKEVLPNDSIDLLLKDTLEENHYMSLIKFIQNTATEEQKEMAVKTLFVISVFEPWK